MSIKLIDDDLYRGYIELAQFTAAQVKTLSEQLRNEKEPHTADMVFNFTDRMRLYLDKIDALAGRKGARIRSVPGERNYH